MREPSFSSALVLFAHPDDAEFMCGGTVAKWARGGCEVHYVVCTDGSAGSNEPGADRDEVAPIREREQRAAADVLGVKSVTFLGETDGLLEVTPATRKKVTREVRRAAARGARRPRSVTPLVRPGLHQPLGPQAGRPARAHRRDARRADARDVPGARGRGDRAVRDPEPLARRATSPTPTSTSPTRSTRRSPRSPSTSPRKVRPRPRGCVSAPASRRRGGRRRVRRGLQGVPLRRTTMNR